ncbi:MAG: DapH/DapD/GlmU-related protein [Erysipelotrichaceae bacterium]
MVDFNLNDQLKNKQRKSSGIYIVRGKIETKVGVCLQGSNFTILIGDPSIIQTYLKQHSIVILFHYVDSMNSFIRLKDIANSVARIERGAIIREGVKLETGVVVLMGAIININVTIEEDSMIDMNAVIGSGAYIGKRVHIGAGAVIAGTLEPICHKGVVIEDDVLVGANAVILEGLHIAKGAIIGAGAIVTKDVLESQVMMGVPAKCVKLRNQCDKELNINEQLR